MTALIYPFLFLASVGFVTVLSVHIVALAGSTSGFSNLIKFLFPGIFVVWLPTILAMTRMTREFKQKDIWKAALRGCPLWMKRGLYFVFGYAFFADFVLPIVYGGGMGSAANTARGMSAIALTFYATAGCVLYSATRAGQFDQSRRCANGHLVGSLAKYCEECGAPVIPASFGSPQNPM
jgi:hypothetical protein